MATPTDQHSPDYRAGYDAGYDDGFTDGVNDTAPGLVEAAKIADRRIIELCATVCQLSGNPRKVRAEDYAEELRAALAEYNRRAAT